MISVKHIEGSKNIGNRELVVFCDIDPKRKVITDELNIPFFTDYRELISLAGIEGAIDGTPNQFHAEVGMAGAEKGWWERLMRRPEEVPWSSPFTAQLEHFCRIIRGAQELTITAAEGLLTLATTFAINEFSETGWSVNSLEL